MAHYSYSILVYVVVMSTEAGYPPQGSINWSDVRKQLESHDQSHLLRWIPELTQDEQEELHKDIMEIDFEKLHVYVDMYVDSP